MVFVDPSEAISAINAELHAELARIDQLLGQLTPTKHGDDGNRSYHAGRRRSIELALRVIEENTQPDDYS